MPKEKNKYRHGIKIKSKKNRKITKEELLRRIETLEIKLSQSLQAVTEIQKSHDSVEKN